MEKHTSFFFPFFVPNLRRLLAHICHLEKIAQVAILTYLLEWILECGSKSTMFHNLNIRIFSRLNRNNEVL